MIALLFLVTGIGVFIAAGMAQAPILALCGILLTLLSFGWGRKAPPAQTDGIVWTTVEDDGIVPQAQSYGRRPTRRAARQPQLAHCPAYSQRHLSLRGK